MAVVMLETPYSGDIDRNVRYLSACSISCSVLYDELVYASHAAMTQHPRAQKVFVSDYDPKWDTLTRDRAIEMSQRMRAKCDTTVFYTDLGWSRGMLDAKKHCEDNTLLFEERRLDIVRLSSAIPFLGMDFLQSLITPGKDVSKFLE
jgi:hypothetical protein